LTTTNHAVKAISAHEGVITWCFFFLADRMSKQGHWIEEELLTKGIHLTNFEEVISRSDTISIHDPLKDSTRNLINVDVLNQMKPGVYLINLAGGGVVDEEALLYVMSNGGTVRGAALDVHKLVAE